MDEEIGQGKRKISLGFEKPEELEGDIIYVDFNYDSMREGVVAEAYSCHEFRYNSRSLDGSVLDCRGKSANSYDGGVCSTWFVDIDKFIQDLVDCNNGVVDRSRLIPDGAKLVTKIARAKESLLEHLS